MMVRKQEAVSGLWRINEAKGNSVGGRNRSKGIREKEFREISKMLYGWRGGTKI